MEPQQTGNSQNNNSDDIKIIPTSSGTISPISNSTTPTFSIYSSAPAFTPSKTPEPDKITFKPTTGMNISTEEKSDEKIVFEPQGRITISPLHTYVDDIKNTISDKGLSMSKIAMAEAKKRESQEKVEEELSPTSNKNIKIIGASLGILVLGVLGVYGTWYLTGVKKAQDIAAIPVRMQSIIPYDQEFTVTLNTKERSKVVDGVNSAKKQTYDKSTAVVYVPFVENSGTTTSLINTEKLLLLLQTRAPLAMVRSFGQTSMFGLNKNAGQTNPFLILSSDSFNQMYAGMLEWEPAMADDIGDLFFTREDLVEAPVEASTTTPQTFDNQNLGGQATSTGSSTPAINTVPEISYIEQKAFKSRYILANSLVFKDEILNNRDMRVLRTTSGKVLMYYTFINDSVILIAKDFNTLDEVVKRLATSQFKQ